MTKRSSQLAAQVLEDQEVDVTTAAPLPGALESRGTESPRKDVELVILRTAWNCSSWYEWAQHVALAATAGLDPRTPVRVMEAAALMQPSVATRRLVSAM